MPTQAVAELRQFIRSAEAAGMSEGELVRLVDLIAADPMLGVGSWGGLRQVRVAREGSGERGGYRTIHFLAAPDNPESLLTSFAKNQCENISAPEKAMLIGLCAELEAEYRRRP